MNDAQELAKKILLYLGKSIEDAIMTFAEDGSTHTELLSLAGKVRDSRQPALLQIETNPTGQHRCLNCGQLKPESELYRGEADWACVDPDHGGYDPRMELCRLLNISPLELPAFEPEPRREDYEELTRSFAQILFSAFQVTAVIDQQPLSPPALRGYFTAHPTAYHLLQSLIASAIQSRSRWGMSKEQRQAEDARRMVETERVIRSVMLEPPK